MGHRDAEKLSANINLLFSSDDVVAVGRVKFMVKGKVLQLIQNFPELRCSVDLVTHESALNGVSSLIPSTQIAPIIMLLKIIPNESTRRSSAKCKLCQLIIGSHEKDLRLFS